MKIVATMKKWDMKNRIQHMKNIVIIEAQRSNI